MQAVTGSIGAARKYHKSKNVTRAVRAFESADSDASQYLLSALARLQPDLRANELDRIADFLRSPEADAIVRSIAIAVLTRQFDNSSKELTEQVATLLVVVVGLGRDRVDRAAGELVKMFHAGVSRAATQLREMAPKEFGEYVDRAMLEKNAGHLRTLTDRSITLASLESTQIKGILTFASQYRAQLHRHTSELTPAYYDNQRRGPIEKLYVQPRFVPTRERGQGKLSARDLVEGTYRPVILGDPGAGKSTLAQQLAHTYSSSANSGQKELEVVPFVVPLRGFESYRRDHNASITAYIGSRVNELFHIKAPDLAIEYLLTTGRALVIFDGLDELLDLGRRTEICYSVETFASLYSNTPMAATSRRIGYAEAPLQPSVFTTYELEPFSDDDVRKYSDAWFALDDRLTAAEQGELSVSFCRESESVPDIRSNALMLGLLCNVYRGIRAIPKNRSDLYEKCANMMFEQWDAQRGIARSNVLKADARAALQQVALWIFTSDGHADGVSERLLRAKLIDYWEKRYELVDDRYDAAVELIRAWRGRSWILTDVGSSASSGESIYKFTHQTFLEYFASVELARTNPAPEPLWEQLRPKLRFGLWEIVGQLAIQRLDQLRVDAADEVFSALLSDATNGPMFARLNLLSFATRNLDSVPLAAATLRKLARAAVDLCVDSLPALPRIPLSWDTYLDRVASQHRDSDSQEELAEFCNLHDLEDAPDIDIRSLAEPLMELAEFHGDYRRLVEDEIRKYLRGAMVEDDPVRAGKAFVLASELARFFGFDEELGRSLIDCVTPLQISSWAKENFWVAIVGGRLGRLSAARVVALSGHEALFCGTRIFDDRVAPMMAPAFLMDYLEDAVGDPRGKANSRLQVRDALRSIARSLGESPPRYDVNWMSASDLCEALLVADFDSASNVARRESGESLRTDGEFERDPQVSYAACILLAVFFERESPPVFDYSDDQVASLKLGPLKPFEVLFISRQLSDKALMSDQNLEFSGWTNAQANVMLQWARGTISFAL